MSLPSGMSIIFVHGDDVVSRAIEFVETIAEPAPLTGSVPSHVALSFAMDDDTIETFEAVPPCVHRCSPHRYATEGTLELPVPCTPFQARAAYGTALAALGRPYGYQELLQALLYAIEGKVEGWMADPGARLDCAAYIAIVLRSAGIDAGGDLPPDCVTPLTLLVWASAACHPDASPASGPTLRALPPGGVS